MKKFTALELETMFAMTQDCFWEQGVESYLWADCFAQNCGMDTKKVRGALASLVKKEIIAPIAKGRDGIIALTDNGKQLFKWLYDGHPKVTL